MNQCIKSLKDTQIFLRTGGNNAYWQIDVSRFSREKPAFTFDHELHKISRMLFILNSFPTRIQRVTDIILFFFSCQASRLYFDRICIFWNVRQRHVASTTLDFSFFRETCVTLTKQKCSCFIKEIVNLIYVIRTCYIEVTSNATEAIQDKIHQP